jgi:hypothetical protein
MTSSNVIHTQLPLPMTAAIPRRRWRKWILRSVFAIILGLLIRFVCHLMLPRNYAGSGEHLPMSLTGGKFEVLYYYSGTKTPKGVVIIGSGDGGWSYWEENTSKHLAAQGYAVGGWDCRKFADSRQYGFDELRAGFESAVAEVRKRGGVPESAPVWYGGWSTGAEQSVAAAASPSRPKSLKGLLLAAPGTHGRFGITKSDLLGFDPSGPGSFALTDYADDMKGLHVAQFSAGLDPLDDTSWLDDVEAPHKVIALSGLLHDMGNAGDRFQAAVDEAMEWTLTADSNVAR